MLFGDDLVAGVTGSISIMKLIVYDIAFNNSGPLI